MHANSYINRYITQQRGITIHSTIAPHEIQCANQRTLQTPRRFEPADFAQSHTDALNSRIHSGGKPKIVQFAVVHFDSCGSPLREARISLRISQSNYVRTSAESILEIWESCITIHEGAMFHCSKKWLMYRYMNRFMYRVSTLSTQLIAKISKMNQFTVLESQNRLSTSSDKFLIPG